MKILDCTKKEDYGVNYVFTLFKGKRRSFLQLDLGWNDYPSGVYLQIAFGNNRLFDILFWCWKFSFAVELLGFTWVRWDD